jgi:hypothetical protein
LEEKRESEREEKKEALRFSALSYFFISPPLHSVRERESFFFFRQFRLLLGVVVNTDSKKQEPKTLSGRRRRRFAGTGKIWKRGNGENLERNEEKKNK